MSIANGVGRAPIGLYEVAELLSTELDVGHVCISPYINKWSRKKPMFIGSNVLESPDKDASIWKERGFGLIPPSVRGLLFDEIENDPSWNAQEWEFDPTLRRDPYRLLDFDGYYHNANAPFDVPGLVLTEYQSAFNGNTANDDMNLVFDISIPITPNTGCIGMFELPQFGTSVSQGIGYRLCLLGKCLSGNYKGEWFVHEDPNLLASYESLAGTMAFIQMQLTVNDMRVKIDNAGLGTTYGDYMDMEWWLCATSHSQSTNAAWQAKGWNRPVDLRDATTSFLSLPTSRPETCHGTVIYKGRASTTFSVAISFWGINNNDYWQPSMGLRPVSTRIEFGQMLMDYTYGLQIGITVTNISQNTFDFGLQPKNIKAIVSRTFEGSASKTSTTPDVWGTTRTQTDVSLDGYVTPYGIYNNTNLQIKPNQSLSFILDLGYDFMGRMGQVATGQTLDFDVTIEIMNYWRSTATFHGRN